MKGRINRYPVGTTHLNIPKYPQINNQLLLRPMHQSHFPNQLYNSTKPRKAFKHKNTHINEIEWAIGQQIINDGMSDNIYSTYLTSNQSQKPVLFQCALL